MKNPLHRSKVVLLLHMNHVAEKYHLILDVLLSEMNLVVSCLQGK